ncbi:radical SAM protein [Vallitalea pronyensis]|uniref:Radical SAM protein n=1 Tax=Vallitalea pronyensis TaxID=1348613 RepID=A0A8J8MNY7_9FIRM|nr:radical SAM protein [Vallitalea pronyensis]QUI24892.1 radical SAM protein [Vallitalea pronyensis]
MKIGLIDYDGKIPNLALMKLSTYYKQQGHEVYLNIFDRHVDKVFCSVLFTWNRRRAERLKDVYKDITFGGTGWDIKTVLPQEMEHCKPDYDLYTADFLYSRIRGVMKKRSKHKKAEQLANMGVGFTSRGCIRKCEFCYVPEKEGKLYQVAEIKDIINPRSNIITLLDNNFTADPHMIKKCEEIKQRNLIVNLSQGIDVRVMTHEKAAALASVKHLRSIHYAWDLISFENSILRGIQVLSEHIKTYRHMCYMLVGYDTTFYEDLYRFEKLRELKVDPYVMVYNKRKDNLQLNHFARWVNARIYKACDFYDYGPWVKDQERFYEQEAIDGQFELIL